MKFKSKNQEMWFLHKRDMLLDGKCITIGDYIVKLREVRGCALACHECDFRKIHYSKACCYCAECDRATKKRHNMEIISAKDGDLFNKYKEDPAKG